jgi:hypothetical protein
LTGTCSSKMSDWSYKRLQNLEKTVFTTAVPYLPKVIAW